MALKNLCGLQKNNQMLTPTFQKKKEDFVCEHCHAEVPGDGYTNHCPKCLWSKHVDINPGDRASDCLSLMEPVEVELKDGEYVLTHSCLKCSYKKRNKVSRFDDFDVAVSIAVKKADAVNKTPTNSVVRAPLGAGQQMIGSFALG